MPSPSVFQILLFYTITLIAIRSIKNNFQKRQQTLWLAVCIAIFALTLIKLPNNNFEITAFDVGNADNFLIKTPRNKYIMIDTGKIPYKGVSSAKTITLEYLYDNNIKELESVIITHFDSDHSGGTVDILENIRVRNLIIQDTKCNSKNSCNILKYIKNNKIHHKIVKNNEIIYEEKDFKITTYEANANNKQPIAGDKQPITGANKKLSNDKIENENSIITLVENKKIKALFMGDSGISAYNELKNYLPFGIDILKIGHHGAKGTVNSEMLNKLKPKYSIISTGFNTYGHPSAATIGLLEESGSKILSTKYLGAIKIKYDENGDIKIYSFKDFKGKTNGEDKGNILKFINYFFNKNTYNLIDPHMPEINARINEKSLLNSEFSKKLLRNAK